MNSEIPENIRIHYDYCEDMYLYMVLGLVSEHPLSQLKGRGQFKHIWNIGSELLKAQTTLEELKNKKKKNGINLKEFTILEDEIAKYNREYAYQSRRLIKLKLNPMKFSASDIRGDRLNWYENSISSLHSEIQWLKTKYPLLRTL